MRKPDSLIARIRRKIAGIIEPCPDIGEAWCIGCKLRDGKTAIFPVDAVGVHLAVHNQADDKEEISIHGMRHDDS